ncbi:MAG TPA: G/U mismatch-specific DNA glycosylase [Phycisphaerales bacterium]|nr:G/U mismatch-specific DNA glycosylase [Phycisphaerales bacterium]
MSGARKPTKDELAAAHGRETVPDLVRPGLALLFVGINPGLWSGATGYHFARPGNRFWPALHQAGLTPRQLHPSESRELLKFGIGMTKVVQRATATAAELTLEEVRAGGEVVRNMVRKHRPRVVCFLGVGIFQQAYGVKKVKVGVQAELFEGAQLWVLPNPSGLNANYQLRDFVRLFREVGEAAGLLEGGRGARRRAPPR